MYVRVYINISKVYLLKYVCITAYSYVYVQKNLYINLYIVMGEHTLMYKESEDNQKVL